MTRNQLDTATVATLTKIMGTRKGRDTLATHRARYEQAMAVMGFDIMASYHGFNDCCDMAVLEMEAAA